jgi:hypothetical protein
MGNAAGTGRPRSMVELRSGERGRIVTSMTGEMLRPPWEGVPAEDMGQQDELARQMGARRALNSRREIVVVPGHWIDPGNEPGAKHEKAMNMRVADALTRRLTREDGFTVWRLERGGRLEWNAYKCSLAQKFSPAVEVLEIHGQPGRDGRFGRAEGLVAWGGPADDTPLQRELRREFGDHGDIARLRGLGVPRAGGALIEAFDTDHVAGLRTEREHNAFADEVAGRLRAAIMRSHGLA